MDHESPGALVRNIGNVLLVIGDGDFCYPVIRLWRIHRLQKAFTLERDLALEMVLLDTQKTAVVGQDECAALWDEETRAAQDGG